MKRHAVLPLALLGLAVAGCGDPTSSSTPAAAPANASAPPTMPATYEPTTPVETSAAPPPATKTADTAEAADVGSVEPTPASTPSADNVPPPFGDEPATLRMYGVIRDAFDGEPHFCLRVGEDALRTCTGGPSLPVVTGLPNVEWDYSDDIVSVKAGLFDVAVDGWEVVRVNPVDVPTEVLELAAAQDYAELIARFPDFVATPEIKWLDPSLLTDLPDDRVAVLTADESAPPERSPDEIEAFEDGLRRHIEQQLPGRYFEISTQLGQEPHTAPTVVVVPHSVDDYLPTIDAARRQATPESAPSVIVLSMAHRLD